jgi:hypothetical protein
MPTPPRAAFRLAQSIRDAVLATRTRPPTRPRTRART